jgi:hypothetical protein
VEGAVVPVYRRFSEWSAVLRVVWSVAWSGVGVDFIWVGSYYLVSEGAGLPVGSGIDLEV